MQYVEGFPKTMVHPSYAPAIISDAEAGTAQSYAGKPARFLPQLVHTPDEEQDMRARGYLNVGEPPAQVHYAEYPKILRHPRHSPPVPATKRSVVRKVDGEDQVTIVDVPAREERFADVTVADAAEEEHWRERGWAPAGKWDADAFEHAHTVPEVAYDPQEWPKWIDGQLVEDPDAVPAAERERLAHQYPKEVNGRRVENAAQEAALANGGEAVLAGAVAPVASPGSPSYVVPAPPQSVLDVAALKAEILGGLLPMMRDLIRETVNPSPRLTVSEVLARDMRPRRKSPRREKTEEERRAIGQRLKDARAAARAARRDPVE
jgi:hypothetical protein